MENREIQRQTNHNCHSFCTS